MTSKTFIITICTFVLYLALMVINMFKEVDPSYIDTVADLLKWVVTAYIAKEGVSKFAKTSK